MTAYEIYESLCDMDYRDYLETKKQEGGATMGKHYEVMSTKKHERNMLAIRQDHETVDSVIDEINEIVKRAKGKGYDNDEKWVVIECQYDEIRNEDDIFVCSTEKRLTVAIYDNGTVIDPHFYHTL